MKSIVVVAAIVIAAGCHHKTKNAEPRDAYPIGSFIGTGGSLIAARADCTYDAPPSVAELQSDHKIGKLVGAGELVETCKSGVVTIDVLAATGARIDGEPKVAVGAKDFYRPVLVAGARELVTLHIPGLPVWTLGKDCDGVATILQDASAQDTGGRGQNLELEGKAKGNCTIAAEFHGQKATRMIHVE